jgi:hypothetical protein
VGRAPKRAPAARRAPAPTKAQNLPRRDLP